MSVFITTTNCLYSYLQLCKLRKNIIKQNWNATKLKMLKLWSERQGTIFLHLINKSARLLWLYKLKVDSIVRRVNFVYYYQSRSLVISSIFYKILLSKIHSCTRLFFCWKIDFEMLRCKNRWIYACLTYTYIFS